MKYIFCTILFLISSVVFSFAQSFNGGLMAGLTTSQIDGDRNSGYNRVGFDAGGYVAHDLSKKFAWQMELKFFQKGSYIKANPDAGNYDSYKLRLNYVEIPFLIRYKYKPKINFDAGLCVGYLAGTKWKDGDGLITNDLPQPFNKFELSYQIGGYYKLTENISFNVRYSYSVLPVRTNIDGQRFILFEWGQFNNVLSFSFYYQFNNAHE